MIIITENQDGRQEKNDGKNSFSGLTNLPAHLERLAEILVRLGVAETELASVIKVKIFGKYAQNILVCSALSAQKKAELIGQWISNYRKEKEQGRIPEESPGPEEVLSRIDKAYHKLAQQIIALGVAPDLPSVLTLRGQSHLVDFQIQDGFQGRATSDEHLAPDGHRRLRGEC